MIKKKLKIMSNKFNTNFNLSKKVTFKIYPTNTSKVVATNNDTYLSSDTGNNSFIWNQKDQKKENKLAFQFLIINSVEMIYVISLSMLIVTANIIPNVDMKYYWARQLSRIVCILSQTSIPMITLAFHFFSLQYKRSIFYFIFSYKKN